MANTQQTVYLATFSDDAMLAAVPGGEDTLK